MVNFRNAKLSDLEDIRKLNRESWLKAYNGIIPKKDILENTGNYPKTRLENKIEDTDLLYVVAEIDNEVVGTINFCWGSDNTHNFVDVENNEAQLRSVYLHPDYWSEGIGTEMFKYGLKKIPEHIKTLKVESLAENDVGRGFYKKLGFKNIKESQVEIFGKKYNSVIQEKNID